MQIWKITAVLFALWLTPSLHALYIGEQFTESAFAESSSDKTVAMVREEAALKIYEITFPRKPKAHIEVMVNKHTGKIFHVACTGGLMTIYDAISVGSRICEGDVMMPTVHEYDAGFRLQCTPGRKFKGAKFDMWAKQSVPSSDEGWTIIVECMDYAMEGVK